MMDVDLINPGLGRLTSWCCREFLIRMAVPLELVYLFYRWCSGGCGRPGGVSGRFRRDRLRRCSFWKRGWVNSVFF